MIWFGIFLFELLILFFLAKKLTQSLSLLIYKIAKSHKAIVNILALIFLPGTILHELAHLLTAGVMLVHVGEISILPEIEGQNVKLGSVQIGKVDPLRLTLVGVAPVVLGLYLIFEISNTMFSSKKDIEGTIGFLIAILIVFLLFTGVLYFLRPLFLKAIWILLYNFNWEPTIQFFRLGDLYLFVPLFLDLLIILITKPLTKGYK